MAAVYSYLLSSVFAQMMYGRLYLNIDLFKELARCFKRNIVLILAEKNGKVRRLTRQKNAGTPCSMGTAVKWGN